MIFTELPQEPYSPQPGDRVLVRRRARDGYGKGARVVPAAVRGRVGTVHSIDLDGVALVFVPGPEVLSRVAPTDLSLVPETRPGELEWGTRVVVAPWMMLLGGEVGLVVDGPDEHGWYGVSAGINDITYPVSREHIEVVPDDVGRKWDWGYGRPDPHIRAWHPVLGYVVGLLRRRGEVLVLPLDAAEVADAAWVDGETLYPIIEEDRQ